MIEGTRKKLHDMGLTPPEVVAATHVAEAIVKLLASACPRSDAGRQVARGAVFMVLDQMNEIDGTRP